MDLIIPVVYLLLYVTENILKSILFSFLTLNSTEKRCWKILEARKVIYLPSLERKGCKNLSLAARGD